MVIAFCRKLIAWSLMISAKVPCSIHPEEATLPLRWLCQLPYAQACGAPRPRLPVALHDLDCPWRSGDVDRLLRTGFKEGCKNAKYIVGKSR